MSQVEAEDLIPYCAMDGCQEQAMAENEAWCFRHRRWATSSPATRKLERLGQLAQEWQSDPDPVTRACGRQLDDIVNMQGA